MRKNFSYRFRRFPSRASPDGFILRPMVPVRLAWRDGFPLDVEMLIDSGADYSMIPADLAEALGVKLSDCVHDTATGIGGSTEIARTQMDCTMRYGGFSVSLAIPMHVQLDRDASFLPLIGREPIFKLFDISFRMGLDFPNGKFVLSEGKGSTKKNP